MPTASTLQIAVAFPLGAYSGSEYGTAEELPSPARLHEALVAAAAGGPWALRDGRVLVAREAHRAALEWLEQTEPVGLVPPAVTLTRPRVTRYRFRGSPVAPVDTSFEPRAAVDGPVVYVWPQAPDDVVTSLREIAAEVTHVGRADSVAIVRVSVGCEQPDGLHRLARRRGPGRVMRVARSGRTAALATAHKEASEPGRHDTGSLGRQAPDLHVTGANETATGLSRFAPPQADVAWPFAEVMTLAVRAPPDVVRDLVQPGWRVAAAVGVHRAIVRAIGEDVPSFVTGRDGDGPLRDAGHLAIHIADDRRSDGLRALLALPVGVADADRELLLAALDRPLRAAARRGPHGQERRWLTLEAPLRSRSALPFWPQGGALMRTASPLVLDVAGQPRRGRWTLEDAVICSIAYAMRSVLEHDGIDWAGGWAFRQEVVARLRERYRVGVLARRATVAAHRFAHRVDAGQLLIAVNAVVDLGRLAPHGGGFLALGRARHLGGGLLVPVEVV
jgi:CRISPR-associated protein Csb2